MQKARMGPNYIRRTDVNGITQDALFPIASWNCHENVLNDAPKTNNAIEGWHYDFNKKFPKSKMPLSQFLNRLKEEEETTMQLFIRHDANPADPLRNARKKKVILVDRQIQELVLRYTAVDVMERDRVAFLRRMQNHLAKFVRTTEDEENEVDPIVEPVAELLVEEFDYSFNFD